MSVKSGFPTSLGSPREAQLPVSGISNKHLQGLPGAFLTPKRLTKRCENATVRSQVAGAEPEHHHHRVLIIMMFMPVLCHVRVLHLQSHSLSLFASLQLSCLDEKSGWPVCQVPGRECRDSALIIPLFVFKFACSLDCHAMCFQERQRRRRVHSKLMQ